MRFLVTVSACVVVALLLALQFPGFWTFDIVPSEPDIAGIEVANRLWLFGTPDAAVGLNPLAHLGAPVWALPVGGLAFPTTWFGLVAPWNVALLLAWFAQACCFVTGWLWALRALGFAWSAAVLPAILVFVSGPFWSFHAVGTMDLASVSLTGWLVVAVFAWCIEATTARAARIGILLALTFVAGDPLMVPFAAAIAVIVCWRHRPSASRIAAGAIVAGAFAVGAVCPFLVEAWAFVPLSERAAGLPLSLYEKLAFSTPPARLLEVVSASFRFTPEEIARVNAGAMNTSDFWYPSLTLGVVFIGLAAWGLLCALRERASLAPLALAGAALVFLTQGRWSPAAAWVWEHVPPLSSWRFPERLWRPALLFALPLVALALDRVAAARGSRVAWAIGALGLAELIAATPTPAMVEVPVPPPEFAALQAGAQRQEVRIGVDRRNDMAAPAARFDTRLYGLPMSEPPDSVAAPVLKFVAQETWPNHFSLQWLGVSHLIMPARPHERWDARLGLGASTPLGDSGFVLRTVADAGPRRGLLLPRARAGVPFDHLLPDDDGLTAPDGALPLGVPRVDTSALLGALTRGEVLVDDQRMLRDGALVPAALPPALPGGGDGCNAPTTVALTIASNAASIKAHTSSSCPALLSVPWRFLQGWRAVVDGVPTPILAINSLTLGVALPTGDHDVSFEWRPPGAAAWPLALATLVAFVGLQLLGRRRQTPRREAPTSPRAVSDG